MNESNVDSQELNHFARLSEEWWDPEGQLKTLHDINPTRLHYIESFASIKGQSICDIGCGGGILSEAMAKKGAQVMGIDREKQAISVAKAHGQGLSLDYAVSDIETWAAEHPQQYDIVTCMELLEHVPHPERLIKACHQLLKPGGWCFLSTINRTLKAYTFVVLGAEYILGLLPKQTHDYKKFIKPSELAASLRQAELRLVDLKGMDYNPLFRQAKLIDSVAVNYLIASQRD